MSRRFSCIFPCIFPFLHQPQVTPSFAERLLSEPWVREAFWSSGDPTAVEPSGQLTLSRLPLRSVARCRAPTATTSTGSASGWGRFRGVFQRFASF